MERNGKAWHGTSGPLPEPTGSVSAWPRGAYLESTQWPYHSLLVTALWPLIEHWHGLFSLCFGSGLGKLTMHCAVAHRATDASTRMIHTYKARLNSLIWILKRVWCAAAVVMHIWLRTRPISPVPQPLIVHPIRLIWILICLQKWWQCLPRQWHPWSALSAWKKVCIHQPILHSLWIQECLCVLGSSPFSVAAWKKQLFL